MNKFKFYFILTLTTVALFSCDKDKDDYTPEPPRDYADQYVTDSTTIDTYLRENQIEITNNPGETSDQDVKISKITNPSTQKSIMSYKDAAGFPTLKSKIVVLNKVNYTLYYLVLREGKSGTNGKGGISPCNVDGVFASYRGDYLYNTTATTTVPSVVNNTKFEEVVYPNSFLSLFETISGWSEVFPEFKTGYYTANANESAKYFDFGAGVMFLPSGLAYYNNPPSSIPAYSPLVFSFKLYEIQRLDQDNDGIPSYLEDLNNDGYMRVLPATDANRYIDDTDKDGIPDFYDVDDDGDNYTTKVEIKNPATDLPYPFAEIPTCVSGTETKKNYLTATCHP